MMFALLPQKVNPTESTIIFPKTSAVLTKENAGRLGFAGRRARFETPRPAGSWGCPPPRGTPTAGHKRPAVRPAPAGFGTTPPSLIRNHTKSADLEPHKKAARIRNHTKSARPGEPLVDSEARAAGRRGSVAVRAAAFRVGEGGVAFQILEQVQARGFEFVAVQPQRADQPAPEGVLFVRGVRARGPA